MQEKTLNGEIVRLRAFQAELTSFDAQLTTNRPLLDKDVADLTTFVTNENKALPEESRGRILATTSAVDHQIARAESAHTTAAANLERTTQAINDSLAAATTAETKYTTEKQALSERKRVVGELKALRKAVQDAQTRGDVEVAGFWLIDLEAKLKATPVARTEALTAAWQDLERKRKRIDEIKSEGEIARADEASTKKALDDIRKTREGDILASLAADR
jgi:hypothetical protein